MTRLKKQGELSLSVESTIAAAKRVIELCRKLDYPNVEQQSLLAAAHFTLAKQQPLSLSHSKLHTNAAITLLQNIQEHDLSLNSKLANAYFIRAEIFEQESSYVKSILDYKRAIETIDSVHQEFTQGLCDEPFDDFYEEDLMLAAQCSISIADILVNEPIDMNSLNSKLNILKDSHPLHYVNKALSYLSNLPKHDDELWATLAYAHQIAGLAFSQMDNVKEAMIAFRKALNMAFKAEPKIACGIIGDIYNCMGLLFEQQSQKCPIHIENVNNKEFAMIYFGIALFFNPQDPIHTEDLPTLLDAIFDNIYRALDPYLPVIPQDIIRDLIDALVFGYYCISDQQLPNQLLCQKLQEPQLANTYAQHLYWLVKELFKREHPQSLLLALIQTQQEDHALELSDILGSLLKGRENNIHYLKVHQKSKESTVLF